MKPMSGCALFGANKVFTGVKDAVVLQHSVIGCHWGSLNFHCTNNFCDIRQASTVIYEENVINGGTDLLVKSIKEIEDLYKNINTVFIISGCVPNIIGDDIDGILNDMHSSKNLIHCSLPGYAKEYDEGIEDAFKCLINLIQDLPRSDLPSINIIGITADDPYVNNDILYLKKFLKNKVYFNCCTNNCTVEDISKMSTVWLNIVLGYGKDLAVYLKQKYNIPFLELDYPYGIQGIIDFLVKVGNKLKVDFTTEIRQIETGGIELVKKSIYYLTNIYQLPAAVIGDKSHLSGMRNFVENELGMNVVIELEHNVNADYLAAEILKWKPVIIFASSFEKFYADKYSIPLVRYIYPVYDCVNLTSVGFIGIEGTGYLLEKIINLTLQLNCKVDGIYGKLKLKENDYDEE